ncbi:hypothetical protein IJJ08_04225 [bacterium]|nr:hypothetical protein [bacterium]
MNKWIKLLAIGSLSVSLLSPVRAQEATDTAVLDTDVQEPEIETISFTKDTSVSEESTSQILQNLENLVRDDNQSEEIINQYDDVISKARGFIGQVSGLKDDAFKITLIGGEELLIAPDKSTVIVKNGETTPGNQAQLSELLAVDDWLVIIGIQNGEVFQPRRIMVSGESLAPSERFVHRGQVKNSQSNKIEVQITGEDNLVESYPLAKSTQLVDQDNETITYKDVKPGLEVLVIGEQKGTAKTLQTLRLL